MGQSVPPVKANVSPDLFRPGALNGGMGEQDAFIDSLCARLVALRKAAGLSQAEMAARLDIQMDRYKKYETRSAIPVYLIPAAADILSTTSGYLLTGRDEGAAPISEETAANILAEIVRCQPAGGWTVGDAQTLAKAFLCGLEAESIAPDMDRAIDLAVRSAVRALGRGPN